MFFRKKQLLKIKELIYFAEESKIMSFLSKVKDPQIFHVYMYNYNWDDGFEIPQLIIDSGKIELSTALLIFYDAGGYDFLLDKEENNLSLDEENLFIKNLYESILHGKFIKGKIGFNIPLTKVQKYKLDKMLEKNEKILLEDISGKMLDISI